MADFSSYVNKGLKLIDPLVVFFKKLHIQKDFHIFFVFLLLSSFFWLIKALNKEYDYTLDYPIAYEKVPDHIVLEGERPSTIQLKIKDTGFQLLRYSTSRRLLELDFNIEQLLSSPRRRLNSNNSFILPADYENKLTRNLVTTTSIIGIKPDTLHVQYSRQVSKFVHVKLNGNVEPAQQRILNGAIKIAPDTVEIYGPERMLDTMKYVYTEYQDFVKLKDTLVRNITIETIDDIRISRKRVNVTVPIEMFTEKTVEVPVTALNFPDSLSLRTFPGMVNVSFFVGISRFKEIDSRMFDVTVDYAEIERGASGNVPLQLKSSYRYISNLRVAPENVVYLLELNE